MSISDTIQCLLDGDVKLIFMGHTEEGKMFVECEQVCPTGPQDVILIKHRRVASSIAVCLDQIKRDVAHCAEMKPMEVPRGNSN